MATPTRQLVGDPLQSLGPPGTFLQRLLEEINGTHPSAAPPQRHSTSNSAPVTRSNAEPRRRTSSIRMGGGPMAQDARQKLRAADEARLRKTQTGDYDAAPVKKTPKLRLQVPDFTLAAPTTGSSPISPLDTSRIEQIWGESDRTREALSTPRPVKSAPSTPAGADLRLPISTIYVSQPITGDVALGTESPLIFCDIDSDISSTPSPDDPPTSALSATGTDATSLSDWGRDALKRDGSQSPGKRAHSPSLSPEMLSKKMRTRTVPMGMGGPDTDPVTSFESRRGSFGGDNRHLVRGLTHVERTPGEVVPTLDNTDGPLPALSSFRPGRVDSQDYSLRLKTPVESRTSSNTPEHADTPIYARSLHLVDTEVSIYHKVHGDEWKDNALCLYCFRLHGSFSKLKEHGYETCGNDEPLESHYWESRE